MENADSFHLSFEFFPPKTEDGLLKLQDCARKLATLSPKYFSVTFGAGGSTQERTASTVFKLMNTTEIKAVPHMSCISSTAASIKQLIDLYIKNNIDHIIALRGDIPADLDITKGEFSYATELVKFIRAETGNHFYIIVACYPEFHPQTKNASQGLEHFKNKVAMGANCAITQYFYNCDAYFRFLDACEKMQIDIPIVPGIMPITNYRQLMRFSQTCGAEIPRWIRIHLETYENDLDSLQQFGEEVVTNLCQKLLDNGAPGLHFYTLNKATASLNILDNLNIQNALKISNQKPALNINV